MNPQEERIILYEKESLNQVFKENGGSPFFIQKAIMEDFRYLNNPQGGQYGFTN